MTDTNRVILVIRDGWGHRPETDHNAIAAAQTPVDDMLMKTYPHCYLDASGEAVGLPDGYQGNSEVGHMTIGSGRIIYQSLARIQKAIEDGSFFKKQAFLDAIENAKQNQTTLHLIGLLQAEGVHAHINHLFALLELCKQENFHDVAIHIITDGRDAPPTKSITYFTQLQEKLTELGFGQIVTISGRYYTMDRNKVWERTRLAYKCIIEGVSETGPFENPNEAIKNSHQNGVTDEFIPPQYKMGYTGINENDSIIFYNFRTDRPRQFTQAVVEKDFEGWDRKPLNVYFATMTQFYQPMNAHVAFEDLQPKHLLGEVISKHQKRQLRISETEKYAHVTFFFNGQNETPSKDEDRILIQSPKVATYDKSPDMSAPEITQRLCSEIKRGAYDFIVVNLVNGDMVGHTGNVSAIIRGIEAVDTALGDIVETGQAHGYSLLVCSDHGNAEDQTPEHKTSHTTNIVPCLLIPPQGVDPNTRELRERGSLADIAPTILDIMHIPIPNEMNKSTLIKQK